MIRLTSEKELLESFRPMDREGIELPEKLEFPLIIKDYFAWTEASGAKIFIVYKDAAKRVAFGITFRRDQSASNHAQMCSWCHAVGNRGEVSLLTAKASQNRRVGLPLCRELDCKDKGEPIEGAEALPITINPVMRRLQILRRISEFARQTLF